MRRGRGMGWCCFKGCRRGGWSNISTMSSGGGLGALGWLSAISSSLEYPGGGGGALGNVTLDFGDVGGP